MRFYFSVLLLLSLLLSSASNVFSDNLSTNSAATESTSGIISNNKVADFLSAFVEFNINLSQQENGYGAGSYFIVPGTLRPNYITSLAEVSEKFAALDETLTNQNLGIFNITANYLKTNHDDKGDIFFELTAPDSAAVIAKADLSPFGMSQNHDYQKGQKITLQCGDLKKADIIILSQCQRVVELPKSVKAYSRNVVEQFLAGKDISFLLEDRNDDSAAEQLFTFGYFANLFPVDEDCKHADRLQQCNVIKSMFDLQSAQFDNIVEGSAYMEALKKSKQFYHLP